MASVIISGKKRNVWQTQAGEDDNQSGANKMSKTTKRAAASAKQSSSLKQRNILSASYLILYNIAPPAHNDNGLIGYLSINNGESVAGENKRVTGRRRRRRKWRSGVATAHGMAA